MIDLTTTYLGLKMRTPLVPSASPLSQSLDDIRRLEDAGASAVVLYSLFEEQLRQESAELDHHLSAGTESFAESLTYFPQPGEFRLGPEGYLNHIFKARDAVDIPVIASLNGATVGGWTQYATQIEQAGADALECNIYSIPTDMDVPAAEVEQTYIEILRAVKYSVTIPVAVKLSPFFSNMANMAKRLDQAGADGLVLFNRFYQPDIDLEDLEIKPNVLLSTPQALRLPLTWIGILYGRIKANLAATSGVHGAEAVPGIQAEGLLPDVDPRVPATASEKRTEAGGVDEREGIGEVSARGGSAVRLCTLGAQSSHHAEGAVSKGS